jgi:general stress protein 26
MEARAKKKTESERRAKGTLEELWELVEGIEVAMLTTRRADGHMVSRPMATQRRSAGADFWFVTMEGLHRTKEWVSVSGVAKISRDRDKIRRLWSPDWKLWFPDEGGAKDGGPEDPRILLIGVDARSAQYMTLEKPQPLVLFELVKSKLMGKTPEMGTVKRIRRGSKSARRARS